LNSRLPSLALALTLVLGAGCSSDTPSLHENLKTVYSACKPDPIRLHAAEKGLQLAFEPCGSNNFKQFTWSPDGTSLYYQASQGGWVMRNTGENIPLRGVFPSSRPAWINDEMLAFAVIGKGRIGVYQVRAHIVSYLDVPQVDIEQLVRGDADDELLYLAAEAPGGVKYVYRLHVDTVETERAFTWLNNGVEEFHYRRETGAICYREFAGDDVTCAEGSSGEEIIHVKNRTRGALSLDGRFLITEGKGAAVKVSDLPPEKLPKFIPEEIFPPAFWLHDVESGKEVLWKGVHGDHFEWYTAKSYFGSFFLWGFEERSANRNIPFGDLRAFLRAQDWDASTP
jgi:hypothetical protein